MDLNGKNINNRVVVGLTGGIACGKSLAVNEFRKLCAHIIDADAIAREVVKKDSHTLKKIVSVFGNDILLGSGDLDRKKVRNIVFNDKKKRKMLERITHPEIIKRIRFLLNKIDSGIIVVDAPLLFEARIQHVMDLIVVVWSSQEKQVQRLMKRDDITRQDALAMIHAQMPLSEKKKKADILIHNTGSIDDITSRVKQAYNKIIVCALSLHDTE